MYLPIAVYCVKFTICLPFMVNTVDFPRLRANNGGKKVMNTEVKGKLPLAETLI